MSELHVPMWLKLLVGYEKCITQSEVSKKYNLTYAQVGKVTKILQNLGFLTMNKEGRKVMITLTEEGIKISEPCKAMFLSLKASNKLPSLENINL